MKSIKISFIIIIVFFLMCSVNKISAVEQLPDDKAYISDTRVMQVKTGTGPFDENDEPGNDSSETNNVVRSFDQVTWTIENTLALKGSSTSYSGGKIYFEATLPNVFNTETAHWETDSMKWIEGLKVSEDGLTISGYYQMNVDNVTIPGKQNLSFVAKIEGAANGIKFQPIIKVWLNGNATEDIKTIIPEETIVSAAPKYNIVFLRNGSWDQRVTVNFGNGDETGRMYSYGFVLQLYNEDISKGLKGIEFPQGDITFDVKMKLERTLTGQMQSEDVTETSNLKLWNYNINVMEDFGKIPGRTMVFSGIPHSRFCYNIPYGRGSQERMNSVYDSGDIVINQTDASTLKITVRDYKFNGIYPLYNGANSPESDVIQYNKNVGCFGAYEFQLFVPDNDDILSQNYNYYLTLNNENFNATSISGQKITEQQVTNDDSDRIQYILHKKGSYGHILWICDENRKNAASDWRYGDATAIKGDVIALQTVVTISRTNEDNVYEIDRLAKFDGEAFEPIKYKDNYFVTTGFDSMKFNMYFVTKPDGTNWSSQDERNKADIEDLVIYENIEDIPEGWLCIGVYYESSEGYCILPNYDDQRSIYTYLKIKDTANIGQTYGFVQTSKYWTVDLDRNIYSQTKLKGYDTYPKSAYALSDQNYIKAEYDENGEIIAGTHSGSYTTGNSLLILGAFQKIQQTPISINGEEKKNFDLGKNENVVRYKIEPTLYQEDDNKTEVTGVTVKIEDTLPEGLTYIPNSCNYGEPEISENGRVLTWYIYNCSSDKLIDPLYFDASIAENTPDTTQYVNTAVMSSDNDKIGNTAIKLRSSTSTIQIINLSSHRLYKITDTSVIEKNNQIHYTISYKNNTDLYVPDFQLLDILPYNGDGRGTEYIGNYIVDRVVVTQKDANGEIISNDNLEILYTDNEDVRKNVSVSDNDLGNGWNKIISENLKKNVTAIAVKGNVVPQGSVDVDIYIQVNNNEGLSKYSNSATARVDKDTAEMTTSNVIVQVVKRTIEGIVWEDSNEDGIKNENELPISNIEMMLSDEEGNQVIDVNGQIISNVKTDSNGYYKFENLPVGNYYIKVILDDGEYMLTQKEVGSNSEINSKFDNTTNETELITKLNGIDLPELTVSNVNAGLISKKTSVVVKYVDENGEKLAEDVLIEGKVGDEYKTQAKEFGEYEVKEIIGNEQGQMTTEQITVTYVYKKVVGSIEITKVDKNDNSKVIEGAVFKIEKIDTSGNIDTEFEAKEMTTGSNGKVLFEGLEVGKYRVTEIKAPENYELQKESIEVEITKENRDVKLTAENELKLVLPETGAVNYTIVFIIVGIVFIISSLIVNRIIKYKIK